MNRLEVGFASVNIDPPLGIGIDGYYVPRFAKGILDSIEVSALALRTGETLLLMMSVDNCMIERDSIEEMIAAIRESVDIPSANIFISATHSHTAPLIKPTCFFEAEPEIIRNYADFLNTRMREAARLAVEDLSSAKMGHAIGYAPDRISYIRRYKMKDGSTATCPAINDPNIDCPIGELDRRVNVLRFDRAGKDSVVLLNYGLHADTVNGEYISADWPGQLKKTLDKALDGTKCIVFLGAEGDVGSTNVHPLPGDMNETEISFDNEMKSPGMARFVGRALAGTVLQVYDKVAYTDVENIGILHKALRLPTNMPTPAELPTAHKYKELHDSGRDDLIPFEAMELTTVVAEAIRMCELESGPEYIAIDLMGVRLGPVAFVGIPGEPFTDIGVEIKRSEGFDMILPCALTNGSYGYFPMRSAYDEGGYEARTSRYKSGVAELITEASKNMLSELAD